MLVDEEPLAEPRDAVAGELLGDEVAGQALQRLEGQLARVVDRHPVAREPQLELERDLEPESRIDVGLQPPKIRNVFQTLPGRFFKKSKVVAFFTQVVKVATTIFEFVSSNIPV